MQMKYRIHTLNIINFISVSKYFIVFKNSHNIIVIRVNKIQNFLIDFTNGKINIHTIINRTGHNIIETNTPGKPSFRFHIHIFLIHYKNKETSINNKIKLYVIQHILHFYWCHFCQSRTREGGNGLDVKPVLLRTKENSYINKKCTDSSRASA